MLSLLATVGGKIAIGLIAGGAVVAGGGAAAAYADLLPAAAQQAAHDVIGAPLPGADDVTDPTDAPTTVPTVVPTPISTAMPVGPDATGPAAFGLCTAFSHGGLNPAGVAYASLARASNGASNIATYCASIQKPRSKVAHGANGNNSGESSHSQVPSPGSVHKPAPGSHP